MNIGVKGTYQAAIVRQAGRIALSLLEQNVVARVIGTTSRGTFLALTGGWVIFLTSEPHRGPLSVNLNAQPQGLNAGDEVKIEKDSVVGPSGLLITGLRYATPWEAPLLGSDPSPRSGWLQRLEETSRLVVSGAGNRGLAGLLVPLLGVDMDVDEQGSLQKSCQDLKHSLEEGDWQAGLQDIGAFLGYGGGLTPSGDDFVLGLLLGMSRIPQNRILGDSSPHTSSMSLESFIGSVVQAARQQTNALSASLIACAAQGQADERLVSALDGIYSGALTPEACAHLLLSWGSSSGGDSLAGMALAFNLKCGK